jgi:hypothetical protein
MRCHWPAGCLLYPVLLLATAPGCQTLYRYRPVPVLVRDAETKQPLPGAEVRIWYPLTRPDFAPFDSCGVTGQDGIARLRAAPYGEYGIRVDAAAPGYLSDGVDVTATALQKVEPAGWLEATEQRPAAFTVELYAEPAFAVELVVPVGYRGLVKAEVLVREDVPCPAGQRCFRYEVSPSGAVQVTIPPLLRSIFPPAYRARYADGTALGGDMDAVKVGFRWLKTDGKEQCFVVGTRTEYESFARDLLPERAEEGSRKPDGQKGGGRGGRSRRGNPSPSP